MWADGPDEPFTAALPSKHTVQGFVTSLAQVRSEPLFHALRAIFHALRALFSSIPACTIPLHEPYLSPVCLFSPTQVNLPPEATDAPASALKQRDYTLLILLSCVLVGIFLGVTFAVGCHSRGYLKVVGGTYEDDDDDGGGAAGEGDGGELMGIPLKTLSGGANYNVDFRECFERAMKARHLPTHESLLVINPKEIILSKVRCSAPM